MSATGTEHALTDGDDLLVSASPRLRTLNMLAGGDVGRVLAVPQLADLARMARTLQIPIARQVVAASGNADLSLHVDARPDGTGARLTIGSWTERAPRPWLVDQPVVPVTVAANGWTFTTDAALRLTALAGPAAMIGAPLTRLVRLIEDDDGDLPLLAAIASGAGFDNQRAVRRDLPTVELRLSAEPLRDVQGGFAGYSGRAEMVRPVLQPAPGLADAAFADRIGKALRAPLDRIVARAETISAQAEGPLRRDYADYAGDIASAGRHLLALVDDLADLEAVDRPDLVIDRDVIDLADLARRAAGLLAVRAADRQVRIDRPAPDDVLEARGDFRRILQILVNLIGNAVRYSPPGAMIWLRTEREGDNAVVVVADQGKGIEPANHARVFGKFERVDATEPGGSGLGLYISQRLARAMGGDITVDSAPGQGARFVLTLPVG